MDKTKPTYYGKEFDVIDFCQMNNLDFMQGNIIKYVTRYKEKNGKEDLLKAKEYIDRINKDYLNNKEEALNFSDKTYKKYSISEPTITIFNSNPFPTNNDEKTQLKINLEASKRIIVEAIIKKQKEIMKN